MSKKMSWTQVALAAVLVAAAGVAIALEETITIDLIQTDGEEVTLKINDTTEVITLEDLADGEERTFYSGEHEVTVRRDGEMLTVTLDGDEIGANCKGDGHHAMVWISEDEEEMVGDAEKRVVIMKTIVEGEAEGESGTTAHRFHYTIGDEGKMEVFKGGPNIFVIREGESKVRYRCEESGEELVVDKELAIEDTYVSPVSGCLMQKVDPAESLHHALKVVREIEVDTGEE